MKMRFVLRTAMPLLVALFSISTTLAAAQGNSCYGVQINSNGSVDILGYWSPDQFNKAIEGLLAKCPQLKVNYETTQDIPTQLKSRLASGNPPDMAEISLYTMAALASDGSLKPLDKLSVNRNNYDKAWTQYGSQGGTWYALPLSATVISLSWYRPDVFKAQGFTVPTTFDEYQKLLDTMLKSGKTGEAPLSMGFAQGPFTAAWFTHDIAIRRQGIPFVERLANGKTPWTSAGMKDAWTTYLNWINKYGIATSGKPTDTALNMPFTDAIKALFQDQAYMVEQADLAVGIFEEAGYTYGKDFSFFVLPGAGDTRPPLQVGGRFIGAFTDTPGVQATIAYLSSQDGANAWAAIGLGLSPNKAVDRKLYSDPAYADLSDVLLQSQITYDVTGLVYDKASGRTLSDKEYTELQNFVRGKPVDNALNTLDQYYKPLYGAGALLTPNVVLANTQHRLNAALAVYLWHHNCYYSYDAYTWICT